MDKFIFVISRGRFSGRGKIVERKPFSVAKMSKNVEKLIIKVLILVKSPFLNDLKINVIL